DQRLHHPGVDGYAAGLHDKGIGSADGLLEPDEDLPVGELIGLLRGDGDVEVLAYLIRQLRIATPGEQHHALLAGDRDRVHLAGSSSELGSVAPAALATASAVVPARRRNTHPAELC